MITIPSPYTNYRIIGVYNKNLQPKTDERSLMRLGSLVHVGLLVQGWSCWMHYIKDNQGLPKEGTICTSNVQDYTIKRDGILRISTINSVYELERVEDEA